MCAELNYVTADLKKLHGSCVRRGVALYNHWPSLISPPGISSYMFAGESHALFFPPAASPACALLILDISAVQVCSTSMFCCELMSHSAFVVECCGCIITALCRFPCSASHPFLMHLTSLQSIFKPFIHENQLSVQLGTPSEL